MLNSYPVIAEKYREKRNAICIPNFLFVSIQLRFPAEYLFRRKRVLQRSGGVGANLDHYYSKEAVTIRIIIAQFRQGMKHSAYSRKDSIHTFIPPTTHILGRKDKEV